MRCFEPRYVRGKYDKKVYLAPCGKCLACRKRKQQEWTFRMDCERRYGTYKNCFFVTLTYHDDYLSYADDAPVLWKDDIVNFFKRLRRYYGANFRYFYCGEYGDKFDRPHWHICLFTNYSYKETIEQIRHAWSFSVPADTPVGNGVFSLDRSYSVKRHSYGRNSVSAITMRRIRYVAKYIVKDGKGNDLYPKFARSSKGLGKCFLNTVAAQECKRSLRSFHYTEDGRYTVLPRYITHRLFSKFELQQIEQRIIEEIPDPSPKLTYLQIKQWYRNRWENEDIQKQSLLLQRSNLYSYGC